MFCLNFQNCFTFFFPKKPVWISVLCVGNLQQKGAKLAYKLKCTIRYFLFFHHAIFIALSILIGTGPITLTLDLANEKLIGYRDQTINLALFDYISINQQSILDIFRFCLANCVTRERRENKSYGT